MTTPTVAPGFSWTVYWRDLWSRREFALYLAMGNLKARNASTALGLFWWVLNPLLLGGIYFLVFGLILDVSRDLAHLLSGMFVFYYTANAMNGAANSILSNAKLLANLRFPRLILPISSLIESAVGFLASVVVFYLIVGPGMAILPGPMLVWLIPALALHTLFNLGLGAITARLVVPFRDINNLVPYLTRLWLYLSPIIYDLDQVPEGVAGLLRLNPMVALLGLYRAALMGRAFELGDLFLSTMWAVAIGIVGVAAFVRHEGHMVRYL